MATSLPKGFTYKVMRYRVTPKTQVIRTAYVKNFLGGGSGDEAVTPLGRTLQIINLPPYTTEESVKDLFSGIISQESDVNGKVWRVTLSNDPEELPSRPDPQSQVFSALDTHQTTSHKVAYVAFSNDSTFKRAFEVATTRAEPFTLFPDQLPPLGLAQYMERYNNEVVPVKEMREEVNAYMAAHDLAANAERTEAKEEAQAGPDEEGWIKVNRASRKSFSGGKGGNKTKAVVPGSEASQRDQYKRGGKRRRKRNADLILPFTYNSKAHERKLEKLVSLKSRFEEDKRKVAENKAKRKPIQPI